ncbi:FecR domain-containing protein [Pedobacter steynii]|nr:FecR family protein [Pedobacter steynii]NQX38423.1 FecR domain-containing protein [Pedobacter steynii]
MKIVNIEHLVDKFNAGECSAEEEQILKGWLHQYNMEGSTGLSDEDLFSAQTSMLEAIEAVRFPKAKKLKLWPRIAAIAAVVATITIGAGLFYYNQSKLTDQSSQTAYKSDIAPGKVGATLTLANGKKIVLSEASKGELAEEAGISITKTADGQLLYELNKQGQTTENKINILSTAKGETYRVRLPDGSLVWLNAASSLTYDFALNEIGERRVKLSGEAYFEIAKDKAHPFVVSTDRQQVRVLGTHFNINSYTDEPVTATTLLEGSVQVLAGGKERLLRPGQEAKLGENGLAVVEANIALATAWKDGNMAFRKTDIQSVLRQISRWYNIEVKYQEKVPDYTITGEVSRGESLSSVLKILELSEVHFELKGRKLTILP